MIIIPVSVIFAVTKRFFEKVLVHLHIMKIDPSVQHLFWMYRSGCDLPEEVIVDQIVRYGDLPELFRLQANHSAETIQKVIWQITGQERWKKRIHFVNKIILET